jgi:hypothetical protein
MVWWTLSATSNTARVRLQQQGKKRREEIGKYKTKILIAITSETNIYFSKIK